MVGLSLEGGGVKGAYQAGAYMAFKKCHIRFNGVVGTSIGSFNAAMIVAGKGKEMVNLWQHIDVAQALSFEPEKMEQLKTKNPIVYAKFFRDIIKNKGISTDGLKELVNNNINVEKIKNSSMDYGLCTVKVKGLKPLYLMKEDISNEGFKSYILNSCYLPIFKMEKTIDNSYFLDGGFYDNAPYNMLINKGYTKIYNVGMNAIGFIRKPKQKVEIINIRPLRSTGGILTFNQNVIQETIKMGYFDTLRVLKNYDGFNYVFKKKSDLFYERLVRYINHKEYRRVKNFFFAKTEKEVVINAVEYVMQRQKIDYYKIYNIKRCIRMIRRNYTKDNFVYNFVRKLNIL